MNLKLFQQECAKKILVVLRDFDPKRNIKSRIQELILKDIINIWNEIKKPDRYKNTLPSDFFEFEFITLSHKKYFENQFDAEIQELRYRLLPENENFLFNHVKKEKNVPADGLKQYALQIWNDILNEKDLNIPSQKEMLANYRCNEIKDQVFTENEPEFKDFTSASTRRDIDDFKQKALKIYNKLLNDYDKTASNYEENIYLNIRKQIDATVSQRLFICFANQAKIYIPIAQKYMRNNLENQIKNSKSYFNKFIFKGDDFCNVSETIKNNHLINLMNKLNDKKVFDYWNISNQEFEDIFDDIIDNQKRISLEEKRNQIIVI
jgi:protein SEY1